MAEGVSQPLAQLMACFQKLPGIGAKTAQRLAFYVLRQPRDYAEVFSRQLLEAYDAIQECGTCHHWTMQSPCDICQNPQRSGQVIGVVAQPEDVIALERSQAFGNQYHVLHGLISPMDGVQPDDLRVSSLIQRIQAQLEILETPQSLEVILILPPTVEGDTTSLYLTNLLKPLGVTLSRIAFGLPVGGELDYVDHLTIARALSGRQLVFQGV